MVAKWSQFRVVVARLGVWRPIALVATLHPEHQISDLVLSFLARTGCIDAAGGK
jgi:hypothetical protein